MIRARFGGRAQSELEGLRSEGDVSIGKEEPRRLAADNARARCAAFQPSRREFAIVDDFESICTRFAKLRATASMSRQLIYGTVVDANDLRMNRSGSKERFERCLNGILFVARGNDDGGIRAVTLGNAGNSCSSSAVRSRTDAIPAQAMTSVQPARGPSARIASITQTMAIQGAVLSRSMGCELAQSWKTKADP